MPTYQFVDKNNGEIVEHTMRIAELDEFKANNPHLERYFCPENLPGFGDASRMSVPGTKSHDSAFEKGIIQRIKEKVPGNTLSKSHKTKLSREW